MKSQRYQKIVEENKKFEEKSPYNFCNRWCERCTHEKQIRCKLYLDDLERRASCIAHGRDEDDPEITEEALKAQYERLGKELEEKAKNIDFDNIDIDEEDLDEEQRIELEDLPKEMQEHIKFVENHTLLATVKQYNERAFLFLKAEFYDKKDVKKEFIYHFETVSWYHTLLVAKLQRALAGFHEQFSDGDFAFYDSVAQFEICRKGILESIEALRKIKLHYLDKQRQIIELLALLNNILSRIKAIEESI